MSRKIVSVLANLGENPYIRYHTKPQAFQTSPQKSLSGELAHLVQSELDQMIKDNKEFVASENRATLIILDRRIDCLAPLLHEISYQCMLADLGGLNNGKYKDEENNKEHVLDETDLFWAQVRTWHISEVMEFVTDKFNKFKEENKAAQWELEGKNQSGSSESKIQALKDVMSSFGDYQTTKEAVSRHMSICLFLSKVFADRLLEEVVDLEQSLVMTDPTDGSFAKLLAKVDKILQNPNIEQLDKFRVVLLAVIAHDGISDAERQRFLQNGRFRMEESQALTNMGMLGVRLSPSMGRKNEVKNPYSLEANVKKSVGKQHKFENAKYTPTINYIAKDQIKSNLDPNWFPYVRDIPSASKPAGSKSALPGSAPTAPVQRKKATWAQKKTSAPTPMEAAAQAAPQDLTENGPRTIIFIIGGSTYSEIKTLTDLRQEMNREIILGSTHVWTPDSFVESLKDLHRPNASAKFIGYKRPPLPQRYERGDASLSRNGRGMDVPVSRSSRGNDSIARSPRGSTRSYDDDRGQRPSRGSPPPPERMRGSPPSERSRSRRSESRGDSSQSRSDGRYDDPRRREPVVDDAEYRNSRRTREGRSPPPRQRQQYNSLNESMSRVSVSDRDERQRPRSAPKETVKEEPPKKKGWFGFSKS
ncbi:Sec1-like protein [Globomyces pollinis-pini]|nr:Sec1-like protein [Globomyces pollinis-pini]